MKKIFFIIFCLFSLAAAAQEHCVQFPAKKLDIITNPSFETSSGGCVSDYFHPGFSVQGWTSLHETMPPVYMNACNNFILADSQMTSDYYTYWYRVASKYFFGIWYDVPPLVPQPIPDGKGILAFTDGDTPGIIGDSEYFKGYIATCLLQPLQKDSLYRFDFYLGFGQQSEHLYKFVDTFTKIKLDDGTLIDNWHYGREYAYGKSTNGTALESETVALFGKEDCTNFTKYQDNLSCLANQGWVQLGTVTVDGSLGSWQKASINFVAGKNIQAIAIGPGCGKIHAPTDTAYSFQYYLDNLQMYKSVIQRPALQMAGGDVCNRDVTLQMHPSGVYKSTDMQWFKNNVPIANATGETLQVTGTGYGEGYYQCRVQNDTVCLFTDSLGVLWQALPAANVLGNGDTTLCYGDSVKLSAATFGATYLWQDGSTAPTYIVKQPGVYRVTVTNHCGPADAVKNVQFIQCADSLFVPSAFTPNSDGANDIFRPKYFYNLSQYSMQVFNRYGQRIFVSNNISDGWNGFYNARLQPPGAYVYLVQYKGRTGKVYQAKGVVTLVR